VELRQLRYFLAVADEGNFGRAAERLYISQPSLSYAIKRLEAELGIRLFDRGRHGAVPTDAGRLLLREAQRVLRATDRLAEAARRHRQGQQGRLRLGFQASGAGQLITRIRAAFAETHPGVAVESRSYDWGGEVPALKAGEVDLAIVWQPADLEGLDSIPLAEEERYIGLPVGHPLAARRSLSIMDVKDVPLAWTRRAPPEWVDWWAVNPRPDGSRATWGAENHNVEEMLDHAAAGNGACISPASMAACYRRPDIVWVPLTGVNPLRIELAWDREADSPLVEEFVRVAGRVARAR
jgi:DNA-binding transcriptional LysR family regulator